MAAAKRATKKSSAKKSSAPTKKKQTARPRVAEVGGLIDPQGKVSRSRDPGLSKERLLQIYRAMVMTRVVEDRALNLQRQGRIGFYVPCKGQEASHLGTAAALEDSDWIFPAYRQPGILFLRGAPLQEVVDEWYGNDGDICKGGQMPCHYSFRSIHFVSISSPIGTQMTHAAGAGMAARYRGDDTVFMSYIGDGGTSENEFHCAMNFAAVYKAPVVFVCENNQWAISTPLEMQTASETMAIKAEAYGMPGVRVDGNDVLATYQVAKEAVDRARRGEGPTFIETVTYRMGPHSSSDDPTRYREDSLTDTWAKKDPLERFKKYLTSKKILTTKMDEEMRQEFRAQVNEAIKLAESKPNPAVHRMFEDVFADVPPQLVEQREDLLSLGDAAGEHEGAFPL